MKKQLLTFAFLLNLSAGAQVKFDIDFESGSVGQITQLDSVYIKTSEVDSLLHLSYFVESRFDPLNPVDTALAPSARWFYFRMIGAKNKYIYFSFRNTDPLRAVYSYDNETFQRFEANEAKLRKISKLFEKDTVYIAYFVPYTNSYLQKRIEKWQQHRDVTLTNFGYSYHNIPMQLLTVTDKTVSDENKRIIWIHGRTHTSETPSSWHLDGMIDALLADNENALAYRKSFVFYIVPFTNPDGVKEGLSRSNSTGVNQEINWNRNDEQTVIEVKNLKKQMTELLAIRPFDMLLNMHSQVANSASYWLHNAKSTSEKFLQQQLLLCYLNMFENNYLSPDELSFADLAARYPEGWIWDNNTGDKAIAMTLETPYSYYGKSNIWVTTENLRDFGKATLDAVAMLFRISTPNRIILQTENAQTQGKWLKNEQDTMLFICKHYLVSQKDGNKITYQHKNLAKGQYKIYKWLVGKSGETPVYDANKWIFISDYTQKKTADFKYKISTKENEFFDAIMLVKSE